MFYVYILKSLRDEKHYIGSTKNLEQRIKDHNRGKSPSVKSRAPFVLVYQEFYQSRIEAIRREKQIKAYKGGIAFEKLIFQRQASNKGQDTPP
jgi:putative endonuclease